MFKIIRLFIFVFICLFLANCSTNPATGKKQFTGFLSDESAEEIGKKEYPKIIKLYEGIYNDRGITDYINDIGQKLVKASDMPTNNFKFVVLNKNMVNAFAMPGGYIYVGRGIIELANDEAELASVLAHEIGHVTARHANSRYSQDTIFNIGEILLGKYVGYGSDKLLNLSSGLYLKSYSRDQEHQADLLSVRYLAKAGYDSDGMSRFLSQLRRNSIFEAKLSDEDISKVDEVSYFDTHPQTLERIKESKVLAKKEKKGANNKEEYLDKINGLLYGQREEQGFVRGQTFAHPEIDIVFTLPKDYKLNNLEDRVVGNNKDKEIIFTINSSLGIENPIDYMRDVLLADIDNKSSKLPEKIEINNLKGAKVTVIEKGKYLDILTLYNSKNDTYFNFTFYKLDKKEETEFINTIHTMTKEEKGLYREYKIIIIKVKEGDTIESLSKQMPFEDFKKERFMMINGLDEKDVLKVGQKVKVVK